MIRVTVFDTTFQFLAVQHCICFLQFLLDSMADKAEAHVLRSNVIPATPPHGKNEGRNQKHGGSSVIRHEQKVSDVVSGSKRRWKRTDKGGSRSNSSPKCEEDHRSTSRDVGDSDTTKVFSHAGGGGRDGGSEKKSYWSLANDQINRLSRSLGYKYPHTFSRVLIRGDFRSDNFTGARGVIRGVRQYLVPLVKTVDWVDHAELPLEHNLAYDRVVYWCSAESSAVYKTLATILCHEPNRYFRNVVVLSHDAHSCCDPAPFPTLRFYGGDPASVAFWPQFVRLVSTLLLLGDCDFDAMVMYQSFMCIWRAIIAQQDCSVPTTANWRDGM